MLNLHVPTGRVVKLAYRDAQPRTVADTSVLDVHFYGPDGQYYCHELPNTTWSLDNVALQFMALNNIRPSDFDGDLSEPTASDSIVDFQSTTCLDVTDQHWLIQLAVKRYEFRLHQNALSGGREALENAEWFTPHNTEESNSGQSEPIGGGSDDDGGGTVTTKLAGEESNSGFTIEIE